MTYDVEAIRSHFPALIQGAAHFDGPGGTQVPDVVADAVRSTMVSAIANRGSVTAAERTADDVVVQARLALADLLGADPRGIVFGRGMTQLTFDFSRTLAKSWARGDEVVVTRLDHDANIRPWLIAARAAGATIRWAQFDPDNAELHPDEIARLLSTRTKVVAVTGASNLVGTKPDLSKISDLAHSVGALVYIDGVHLTAHAPVDVAAFGADFYACSPYKFFGPHCGAIAGRPDVLETLSPDKILPSSDEIPERFELGTLPYELMAGTTAAINFLADLSPGPAMNRRDRLAVSMTAIEEHEDRLRARIEAGIGELDGVVVRSRAERRTPTLLLTFHDRDPSDAYRFLGEFGVNAPAGAFYAVEASRWLGLGDQGGLRVGLAPYSSDADVDRLLDGLKSFTGSGI